MNKVWMLSLVLIFMGCSTLHVSTQEVLPESNTTRSVTLFSLTNYTDTPQAGQRASNIIEGTLLDHNYTVINAVDVNVKSLSEQVQYAKSVGASHLLIGGVSEWRYKTGIDGEPAISLQCKLVRVHDSKVVWNSTASSNDWGNASLGTTAQNMIESMFE